MASSYCWFSSARYPWSSRTCGDRAAAPGRGRGARFASPPQPPINVAASSNIAVTDLFRFRIAAESVKVSITSKRWRDMLFESLFKHADAKPHEIAVTDDTGSYSWQQLAAAA